MIDKRHGIGFTKSFKHVRYITKEFGNSVYRDVLPEYQGKLKRLYQEAKVIKPADGGNVYTLYETVADKPEHLEWLLKGKVF